MTKYTEFQIDQAWMAVTGDKTGVLKDGFCAQAIVALLDAREEIKLLMVSHAQYIDRRIDQEHKEKQLLARIKELESERDVAKTMIFKPIRNEEDYQSAMKEISSPMDSAEGSLEEARLEILAALVRDYEYENHPIDCGSTDNTEKVRFKVAAWRTINGEIAISDVNDLDETFDDLIVGIKELTFDIPKEVKVKVSEDEEYTLWCEIDGDKDEAAKTHRYTRAQAKALRDALNKLDLENKGER